MSSSSDKRRALRDRFWASAEERVLQMNLAWNSYEQRQDIEAFRKFTRDLHTLKGESRMLGFLRAGDLMHLIEDVVGTPSDDPTPLSPEVGDLILEGLDWVLKMLASGDASVPAEADAFINRLRQANQERTSSAENRLDPLPVKEDAVPSHERPTRRNIDAIRVSWEKLERMRDAIAELMLARIRLTRTVNELGKVRHRRGEWMHESDPAKAYREVLELVEGVESQLRSEDFELERLVAQLEVSSRDLRLVPIGTLFDRYPRAVRRIGRELGKKAILSVVAEPIEIDRVVVEALYEPVLHLVRNAIDHGIESPEERLRAGKNEVGTVTLGAQTRGNNLELTVIDDGAGISVDRIREAALESGMISQEKADALTDEQWTSLLFMPSFTTLPTATTSSGRGIGLDVVRAALEAIGGTVKIHSDPGHGTRFTLEAPVTTAITTVVLMKVGLGTYAIPANSVQALVPVAEHPVSTEGEQPVITYQGNRLHVISMEGYLDETSVTPDEGRHYIILEDSGVQVALDGVRSQVEREVVIKSAVPLLGPDSPFRAVVALEDGTLALVLKLGDLVTHPMGPIAPQKETPLVQQMPHALVVDDSPIVRQLIGETLKSRGLKVTEASDGTEGFEMVRTDPTIDIVLTDIHMPEMSGLELIRNIRTILSRQPKILVISLRGTDSERERAFEAGADDYLVKTDISHRRLWDLVSQHLS